MTRFLLHVALAYAAAVVVSPVGTMVYEFVFEGHVGFWLDTSAVAFYLLWACWLLPALIVYQLIRQLTPNQRWWHTALYFTLASPMFWLMLWYAFQKGEGTSWGRLISIVQGLGILAAYGMLRWLHRSRRPVAFVDGE